MRVAPKGKYFVIATDTKNGRVRYPFYDGWNTKREAQAICEALDRYSHGRLKHSLVTKDNKPV